MAKPRVDMADKTMLVVGGTTGLGLSAARALVSEGAKVVVVGRSEASAVRAAAELGDSARAAVGDATQSETSDRAVAAAVEFGGRLDGLYHVAGGSGRRFGDGPLDEVTDGGIERTLALNLSSMIRSNRAAVKQFLRQGGGGVILNMGSVLGFSPAPSFFATHVYAASKSAAVGFTKSIAAYYAGDDIRANVIAPALVETPMAQRAANDDAIRAYIRRKQPLEGGRIGRPEDLDGAAVFLLGDGARYVTGQVLAVDGGWCVSEGRV
ncbi:MAG: SDR family oxidoreductase [Planctomycetota bacterium]